MNSRVEPEVICGPLSETASRIGAGLVVGAQVDPAVVVTGVDEVEQAFGVEGGGEGQFDLGGGFLDRDDRGQPFAGDQVLDDEHRHPGRGEVRRVVDPDAVGPVLDPVREWLAHAAPGPRQRLEMLVGKEKHATHARRRHPHPVKVGAPVGELAMRAVDLAPFVEQGQDRIDLLGQRAVHRGPARCPVGQLAAGTPGDPAVRPPLRQLQLMTDPAQCPACVERLVLHSSHADGARVRLPCRRLGTKAARWGMTSESDFGFRQQGPRRGGAGPTSTPGRQRPWSKSSTLSGDSPSATLIGYRSPSSVSRSPFRGPTFRNPVAYWALASSTRTPTSAGAHRCQCAQRRARQGQRVRGRVGPDAVLDRREVHHHEHRLVTAPLGFAEPRGPPSPSLDRSRRPSRPSEWLP
jgi:hypothetical protein